MLTTVKIGALRDAIAQAAHTLDTKASSIGSWLYLIARHKEGEPGVLYVYSSNLGLARTLLKLPATVKKDGEVIILPKLLQAAMSSLPEDDEIELNLSASGAKLQVKYESIKSEIAVHADSQKASQVLQTIPFNAKPSTSVSAATLVEIINRTLFCTASGTSSISEGPWLASLQLETSDGSLLGIATNRIIAGQAEVHDGVVKVGYSGGIHRDALVALKALLSKRKEEEVTITNAAVSNASNETLFRFSDVILGVRQLSKAYPKQVAAVFQLPSGYNKATINRSVLLSVFGRLSAFAEGAAFTATFAEAKVTLLAKGYNSVFQEQVAKVENNDSPITIGLGVADMLNILMVMKSEDITIFYKSDVDHVHFKEGELNFRYVLSPVQVPWATKGK